MFVIDFSSHLTKKQSPVRNVRISPDSGTLAATLGAEGVATEAVWWNLADNKPIGTSDIFPPNWSKYWYTTTFVEPVFTPDLAHCAIHGYAPGSGSAEFHNVAIVAPGMSQKQWVELDFSEDFCEESLEALAISPDGRWLLAGHGCGRMSRVDLRKAKFGRSADPLPDPEEISLAQDPEDEWDGWDAADASALAVSPDGKRLATGHSDGEVRLFNFRSRKQLAVLLPPDTSSKKAGIRGLTFSPDGERLTARTAGRVTVLDLAGKSTAAELRLGEPTDVAFHPDGTRILTGGLDERVRVWDTITWKEVAQFDWKIGPIHSVTVSPDGLTAAAGGENSRVVVWDFAG